MVVALTPDANAASQIRRAAQDGYGSFSTESSSSAYELMSASTRKRQRSRGAQYVAMGQKETSRVSRSSEWRMPRGPYKANGTNRSRLGYEYVAAAILGQRADVRHQPVRSRNDELVGDRTIENLPACLGRHLRFLIDRLLPVRVC
jgi:hypothetical protein